MVVINIIVSFVCFAVFFVSICLGVLRIQQIIDKKGSEDDEK